MTLDKGKVNATFDLVAERWLPVERVDGSSDCLGLRQLLLEARDIRRLSAETPTVTAALYRLVLAFAHRAYGPADSRAWVTLWDGKFAQEPLVSYLSQHPGRFDLFDPEWPFLQCPALATGKPTGAAKLVPSRSVGNNATLFDHTTARDRVTLEPAEAARWLMTVHAYDPGGLKTPYRKVKSSERAPANLFGMVLVEGTTLHETLLLNMPIYKPEHEQPEPTSPEDRPLWEVNEPPNPEPDERSPLGWTDLLTWPSRRVLLLPYDDGTGVVVDKVVITPGTRLRGDLADIELLAAFRRPPRKARQKKREDFRAVRLDGRRGIWRHTEAFLLAGDEDTRRRPRALGHIADLVESETIPEETVYTIRVFGQQLGSKGAVVESWAEEAVSAPVALLRARHAPVGPIIGHAVDLADQAGGALRDMDRDFCTAMQAEPGVGIDLPYWAQLPQPFDEFLRKLAEARRNGQPETDAIQGWVRAVRKAATAVADRWAYGSPRKGRNLSEAGKQFGKFTGVLHHLTEVFVAKVMNYVEEEVSS
ncbi:type I-E CRISPR-associated protein Cse1/CasA [Sphaerimonospora cavernae]|uniref:Type I-E CRISPR-associated protein Cse1/CasA n=1 Tax=Sphaerimonospora cavernae TaxID=1740611 RepID=A0ABV6U2Z3_9ACTN